MAADLFTKSFHEQVAWDAACWLVNICDADDIPKLCALGDKPPPQPQGGNAQKRGIWSINSDGSGSWTRVDKKC